MGLFGESKKERYLRDEMLWWMKREAEQFANFMAAIGECIDWASKCAALTKALQEEKAKAEKEKDVRPEATPPVTYSWAYTPGKPCGDYTLVDPEAERVASLPKCGTMRKCPKCGSAELTRRFMNDTAPQVHHILRVFCLGCSNYVAEERPLDNKGVAK